MPILALFLLLAGSSGATPFSDLASKAQETRDPQVRVELYTKALAAFQAGHDDSADRVSALVGRAYALDDLKRYEEGLADLAVAQKAAPSEWTVHKAKGYILDDMGRCQASSAAYAAALGLAPPEARSVVYRELGLTLRDCARDYKAADLPFVKAIEAAAAVKDLDDMTAALRAFAANACRQGRFDAGIQALDKSLTLIADDTGALYDKAVCLDDAGRYAEAKTALSEVIRRAVDAGHAAGGYSEAGRRDDGKTLTVLPGDPNELPDCYFRRAGIEKDEGDHIGAARDYKAACKLGLASACKKR